jgi:outer membrane protein assembly factor BamE (lipoprotein component of BamABCDE complex)
MDQHLFLKKDLSMRKLSVVAVILVSFMLSSCSFYTCPTYSNKKPAPVEGQVRI